MSAGRSSGPPSGTLPNGMSAQGLGMVVKHLLADPTHAGNFHHDPRRTVKGLPYLSQSDKSALSRVGTDKLRKLADAARHLQQAHAQVTRARQPMPRAMDSVPRTNPASGGWPSKGALPQSAVGQGVAAGYGDVMPSLGDIFNVGGGSSPLVDPFGVDLAQFGLTPDQSGGPGIVGDRWGFRGLGTGTGSNSGDGGGTGGFSDMNNTPGGGRPLNGAELGDISSLGGGRGPQAIIDAMNGLIPSGSDENGLGSRRGAPTGGFGLGGAADYVSSFGRFNPGAEAGDFEPVEPAKIDVPGSKSRAGSGERSGQKAGNAPDPRTSPDVDVIGQNPDDEPTANPTTQVQQIKDTLRSARGAAEEAAKDALHAVVDFLDPLGAQARQMQSAMQKTLQLPPSVQPRDDTNPEDGRSGRGPGAPREDSYMPAPDDSSGGGRGPRSRGQMDAMPAPDDSTGGGRGPRSRGERPNPEDVGPGNPHSRLVSAAHAVRAAAFLLAR